MAYFKYVFFFCFFLTTALAIKFKSSTASTAQYSKTKTQREREKKNTISMKMKPAYSHCQYHDHDIYLGKCMSTRMGFHFITPKRNNLGFFCSKCCCCYVSCCFFGCLLLLYVSASCRRYPGVRSKAALYGLIFFALALSLSVAVRCAECGISAFNRSWIAVPRPRYAYEFIQFFCCCCCFNKIHAFFHSTLVFSPAFHFNWV